MPVQPSSAAIVIGGALSVLILILWLLQLAFLTSLGHSDAAGNALGQAFAAIEIGILWLVIAILALIAFFKGNMSRPGAVAALILIPLSFVVSQLAADLLGRLPGGGEDVHLGRDSVGPRDHTGRGDTRDATQGLLELGQQPQRGHPGGAFALVMGAQVFASITVMPLEVRAFT